MSQVAKGQITQSVHTPNLCHACSGSFRLVTSVGNDDMLTCAQALNHAVCLLVTWAAFNQFMGLCLRCADVWRVLCSSMA